MASYTAILVGAFLIVAAVWGLMWKVTHETIAAGSKSEPVAGPETKPVVALPPVPVKDLPTLAMLFEGPVGNAMTNAFVRNQQFRLVERAALDKALSNLRLKDRLLIDPEKGQQVGKVVGAKYFMVGSAVEFKGQLHINVRLIETETTYVPVAIGIAGDPKDAVKLAEELAGS